MDFYKIKKFLINRSTNSHYTDRYLRMVASHQNESYSGETFHKHHILPKSIFPEYEKCEWNMITISPRLHLILHWCLHYALGGSMTFAYFQMCIHPKYGFKITPRQYNTIKDAQAREMRDRVWCMMDGNIRRLHPLDPLLHNGEAEQITDFKILPHVMKRVGQKAPHHAGTVAAFDLVEGEMKKVNVEDIDYVRYLPTGILRDQESRNKTSSAMKGRIHCHDPITSERKFIKNISDLPDGWCIGYPPEWYVSQSEAMRGKCHYHNPQTGEAGRFYQGEVPDGWKYGRVNFTNVFASKVPTIDRRTGENVMINKGESYPRYHTPHKGKHYFVYDDGLVKIFSPTATAFIEAIPIELSMSAFYRKDVSSPFMKGKHKGKTLHDLGIRFVPYGEWNESCDDEFEWRA